MHVIMWVIDETSHNLVVEETFGIFDNNGEMTCIFWMEWEWR